MKANLLRTLLPLALVFTMISCSSDETVSTPTDTAIVQTYDYNQTELRLAELINNYRESIGLNRLDMINYISYKSEEHNEYMIENNVVNHDYFQERVDNLVHYLGAKRVNENIAYNYQTPEGALNAWIASPTHKANLEGDYTDMGISVTIAENGKKYYT
ncbi:MAG: CAP domain-containing protein, partial [Flavobacterium sp.]